LLLFGVTVIGVILLNWVGKKIGIETKAAEEQLKTINETAQKEIVKEVQKVSEQLTKPQTIETQPDESVTIKPVTKTYVARDENGRFTKVEDAPKRGPGRPRKAK
jgi:signal transduction histidine kinase